MRESRDMLTVKSKLQKGTHSMMYGTAYFFKSLKKQCVIFLLGKQIQRKVWKGATRQATRLLWGGISILTQSEGTLAFSVVFILYKRMHS